MGPTCGVDIALEGNVEVEVGEAIIGRGLETTGSIVSGVVLDAFCTSSSW